MSHTHRYFMFTPGGTISGGTTNAFESLSIAVVKQKAQEFLEETKAASVRYFVSDCKEQEIVHEETLYRDREKQFLGPENTVFVWRGTGIKVLNDSGEVMVEVSDLLAFAEHFKETSK